MSHTSQCSLTGSLGKFSGRGRGGGEITSEEVKEVEGGGEVIDRILIVS